MGYKRAGYDVVLANDIDPEMAWHYKTNLHPRDHVLCPIKELASKLPADVFGIDLLDGSPPCSSFSTAGNREKDWGKRKHFREGQAEQVLDDLFFDFIALAEKVRPRAIIAENVTGLMKGNAKGFLTMIFARLRVVGYRPQMFMLDASRCGVPQKRERVFVCAQRDDQAARPLKITAATSQVSAASATCDLVLSDEEISETVLGDSGRKWWPLTRPGESFSDAVERTGAKPKLWGHVKLLGAGAAPTLTAVDTYTHWSAPRHLSFREWKRLGSFPDDYIAKTPKIGKYMIGMSVPPKMAEVVGAAVRDQWLT
jgi:DNA (cytosine-5)-methyltransferase 1